jgi:homoserine acetyltransferase
MSTRTIQALRRSAATISHTPSRRTCLTPSRRTSILSSTFPRFLSTRTFPCVERNAEREARIVGSSDSGPEPPYARPPSSSYSLYHHKDPFPLVYTPHQPLPEFTIAYESWGNLNETKDNAILLHTGLSASSHAASTSANPAPGWWEEFIGPGRALDTDKYFIVCTNVLGGCYGSTGPSSIDPWGENGERYGTRFPILSIFDMVRAQFHLLDHLGVNVLAASVGSSMGAMQSLAAAWLFPDRVSKLVSISGTARSTPASIATRFSQRSGKPSRNSTCIRD